MKIELVDNISSKLIDVLSPAIARANECKIAVAFVSVGGLSLLQPAFRQCTDNAGSVELLMGLDLSVTDPGALNTLYNLAQTNPNIAIYCFTKLGPARIYHPKLYMANTIGMANIAIGSSNLTQGGLKNNLEINVSMQAGLDEEIVSDVHGIYNKLKFQPRRVAPDKEFCSIYEEMYYLRKNTETTIQNDTKYKILVSRFTEKADSLHSPVPSLMDLFGWQKMVFGRLPEGHFQTSDIYKHENEFVNSYKENRNIRAKIRQILQQLRDLGLIKHLSRGTWVKAQGIDES